MTDSAHSPQDGGISNGGKAVVEAGALIIRVPQKTLPQILEGAWAMNKFDTRYKIIDIGEFAKELMYALNREDEQGTTAIHRMFDQAILDVIESGGFGIDEEAPAPALPRAERATGDAS